MTDYGRFMRKRQEQEKTLADEVARGKRERQAVLQRVRRQRAMVFKRLAAKVGRVEG
jgi:hypothetical protein